MVGIEWSMVPTVRFGTADLQAARAQSGEGLRRSHFVNEVQIDVKDGG